MAHWCAVGNNDFLLSHSIDYLKSDLGIKTVVYRQDPSDVYYLLHSAAMQRLIVVYEVNGKKHDALASFDIDPHHLIWHVSKKSEMEKIPVEIPKARILHCDDLNDVKFLKFIENVLKEQKVRADTEIIGALSERLPHDDLYYSYSELVKLAHVVPGGEIKSTDINWIGESKKKTIIDLFNAFLLRGDTPSIINNLESQDVPVLQIFAYFIESVEKILLLRSFKSKGGDLNEFASEMNIHPYYALKLDQNSGKVRNDILFAWHSRLCELDVGIKYSGVNGYLLFKSFLLETHYND